MDAKWKYLFIPLVLILCSGFFRTDGDIYFQVSRSIDVFGKVYKEVSFNYVDYLNPEEFMISGINGMLSSLDPYTVFIDEKRKSDIDLLTSGKYGGIGISIGLRNDKITIVDIMDGYSAQRQGIRIGDVITKINNVEINKDNFEDISSLVKGEPGTEVQLTIGREGDEEYVFNLIREEIKIKNLTYGSFVPENSNNVFLKLTGFTRTAGDEIQKTLTDLKLQKGVSSIILDLRGNPGGLLDAAVDVCEKFLKKNQLVVTVRGRDSSSTKAYYSTEEPVAGDSKLVVLVDSGSASASEIVAAAIQDHDRGIILGTDTFGKGLVQTVIPLSYNTSLKITTAKYYTPSGRCIQKIDYSRNNKVFVSSKGTTSQVFKTDHDRQVFGAGGIKPDTFVVNDSEINVVNDLSSKGMIFKYANIFTNSHSKDDFYKTGNDFLFNNFLEFLKKENYKYKSAIEKQLTELLSEAKKEKYNKTFLSDINSLEEKIKGTRDFEIKNHKQEILNSLRSEMLTRYEGSNGRIRELLNNDRQFKIALEVVNNNDLYNHLLYNH
ncbi:MAG: S41 family peptidase [Bacteroidota bacterium]|nr:S41 family peptidase [Bacteroidota bacterium]MDP4192010.1 S41 family peptidase [Bacteroidota bacterium]MDP4195187.1 S41 family peptidase [Bacteroidota bacterium]